MTQNQVRPDTSRAGHFHAINRIPTRILGRDLLISHIKSKNQTRILRRVLPISIKKLEIQRAYYGAIWLIWITKNDAEIQFTRGACKNQRFSTGSHRPDLYRVSDRDIKINKIAKSAPDCRRAYYGAIPRARAFSECAQNPSVSVATPRILVTGQVGAPRGPFEPLWRGSAPRDCVPRVYGDLRTGTPKCARRPRVNLRREGRFRG